MSTMQIETETAVGADSAGLLMTPEEFDAVDNSDENFCYELVNGVLVVMPIPLAQETGPNELLGYLLLAYQAGHPHGDSLDLTLPQQYVRIGKNRRLADRLIWAGLGRLPNRRRDVATIAVEFVSSGRRSQRRDYQDKRKEYRTAGVSEYWIIDRFRRTMTVIHYRSKKPRVQVVGEEEVYSTRLLPGFEVPLAKLLMTADMLAEDE